jgi:TolB-like protein/Flp pilus assembly protein TadD/predicted Ser/Thr protein kinase
MPFPEGHRLGQYEIVALLGAGGMGEVYSARDTVLRRTVAVKVLHGTTADARSRLLREARTASALNHPNICTIHNVQEAGDTAFIVMEYVSGRLLKELIETGVPSDAVRKLAGQIVSALAHAHDQGVIHRDLKSANVMVTASGQTKVLDFGIAARPQESSEPTDTTASGTSRTGVSGTVAYMAPEVLRGKPSDRRSDIWAFGVLLYEMATRRLPYSGATAFELSAAILNEPPPPLPVETPAWLIAVVAGCLAKNPDERYQNAGEIAAVLDAATDGTVPIVQRVPSPARPARTAPIAAAVAALAAAAIAAAIWLWPRDGPPAATAGVASVAVLPLEDLSGKADQAYFRDGMTDALITTMSRESGLRVVPRTAVLKYGGTRRAPGEIAAELQVDSVMEGTILRVGDRVRVTAQLVDGRTNGVLWTGAYERDLSDVLALQSEVATAIATELRLASPGLDTPESRRRRTVDPRAYDAYLLGLSHISRNTRQEFEQAVDVLERAVTLDPTFADAHGALACAYVFLYAAHVPDQRSRLEPLANAAIEKALSLDPNAADAYIARGRLLWTPPYGWPHDRAIENYRRALELNPTSDLARNQLAIAYNHIGRPAEAHDQLRHAEQVPATLHQSAMAFQVEGKHDQALATWLAIPEGARGPNQKAHILWVLLDLGRAVEADAVLRNPTPADIADPAGTLLAARALLEAAAGRTREARALIAQATTNARTASIEFHHAAYLLAFAHARMGDSGETLRWLRYMAANGFPNYPLISRDKSLDGLRSNPQFVEFLEELRGRWDAMWQRSGGRATS